MSDRALDIPGGLVARARDDDRVLEQLVAAVAPHVRRWAWVQTGNAALADDLMQEVLIRMIRNLEDLPEPPGLTAWLYTVTRNAATDYHRRSWRHETARTRDMLDYLADDSSDPAGDAERSELAELLHAFFKDLPRRQREVFDLVELQGVSATEAAQILGIRPTSVRGNLFKARRNLRRRILATWPDVREH